MKFFLTICAVLMLASCTEKPAAQNDERYNDYCKRVGSTYDDTFRAASNVDTNRPIGEFEAFVLSSAYFYIHFGGCGGTKMPKDKGDTWVSDTSVGYAGQPGAVITVEKKTGITYSEGKPRVSDPKTYLQFVKPPNKVTGANVGGRFRFALERIGSPRHRSHVALFSLGHIVCQTIFSPSS